MWELRRIRAGFLVLVTAACWTAQADDAETLLCAPASLSVVVGPEEAADQVWWQVATEKEGDQWVLNEDPGAWLASGETCGDLRPGCSAVVFLAAGRWAAPDPVPTLVCGGSSHQIEVNVQEVSIYATVGEIPSQVVRHGDMLSFLVEEGGTLDPAGTGGRDMTFEGGRFEYRPSEEERGQFKLTFNAPGGSSNKVLFDVLPILPAEQEVIEYKGTLPDPERMAYLNVTEERAGGVDFNYQIQEVRDVRITGVRVVFQKGHPQGLYGSLAYDADQRDNDNVRTLDIYADQVIVRERLHLPGTNVMIHARELRFEDPSEGGPAAIVTTPVELLDPPSELPGPIGGTNDVKYNESGKPGRPAGNVTLNVGAVHAPENAPCLILKGGNGQDGEDGWNGTPLSNPERQFFDTWSYSSYDVPAEYYGRVIRAVWDVEWWCSGGRTDGANSQNYTNAYICARSGNDAVGDGASGYGGSGGKVSAPFDLSAVVYVSSGSPGRPSSYRTASLGDYPEQAVHLRMGTKSFPSCGWTSWRLTLECNNRDGLDSPPKPLLGDVPQAGTMSANLASLAWLHPLSIRTMLHHARDLYLNGYPELVREIVEPYSAALEAYLDPEQPSPPPPEVVMDLSQLQAEISTILHRLDNHLDYFGYPAGWVPMLSFEVELQLFQNEVAAAGDILYVTHYLSLASAQATNKAAAMTRLRAELSQAIEARKAKLQDASNKLQSFWSQAEALDRDIRYLGERLKAREEDLKPKAERYAFLKKAFRVAARVLPMIPIGQPALGLIGTGLGAASKFNEQSALDCAIEGTNVASEFLASNAKKGFEDFKTVAEAGDPRIGAVLLALQKSQEMFNAELAGVNQVLKEAKTWEEDVNKEIQILAAEDEAYQELVEEIKGLNKRKRQFAEEMASLAQLLKDLMDGINRASLGLANLNRDVVSTAAKIDQEAFQAIKEMEQEAKDRLLKYQYYLIKSYHYRMLEAFDEVDPDAFQLQDVYDHFQEHFTNNFPSGAGEAILPRGIEENLVVVYRNQLRRITARVAERLRNEGPSKTDPIYIEISPNENPGLLDQLNRFDGPAAPSPLRLNLYDLGRFSQDQEDLRISSLSIHTLEVRPREGTRKADLILKLEHSGESLIGYRGETYRFLHHRTVTEPPIHWRTRYSAALGTHEDTTISEASGSLLTWLLEGESGPAVQDMLLYSRPSASADLIVTKDTLADDIEMVVEKLILKVEVDYYTKPQRQAEIQVRLDTTSGLELTAPLVLLGSQDRNGRGDGRGRFRRVFQPGNLVDLEAPLQYGAHEFDRWEYRDAQGKPATSASSLVRVELPTADAPTVTQARAVYRPRGVQFQRGNTNGDESTDISDAISLLGFLFLGNEAPPCMKAADVNDDGFADISDAIGLLGFLFLGTGAPPTPFEACGRDLISDGLSCLAFPPCP